MTNTTVRAYVKDLDLTPRKVSLVASLVRNRSVDDALVILSHTPKRAALPLTKAINSAKSNAINTYNLDGKTLTISTLSVTAGSRLKRFKPAARGRALPFEKKKTNILVEVSGLEKVKKPTAKPVSEKPKALKSVAKTKTSPKVKKESK